ncbi:MAG: STM4014 family protein [Planctomycetales bacterium]
MPSDSRIEAARRWTVIGHPGSRRVAGFERAVARLQAGTVTVIPYDAALGDRLPEPPPPGTVVRIESPGGNAEAARRLLLWGVPRMEQAGRTPLGREAIERLAFDRGEMLHPRQWMFGLEAWLQRLGNAWGVSGVEWMSTPASIALAFDKLACLQRWDQAGLPTPRRWSGLRTYHAIRQTIGGRHARVFLKLQHGYSAMGAVALEWRGDRVRAITSVETAWSDGRPRLFLSKRPRVLLREYEIAMLIDTLGMEDILVEEWLSKARYQGKPFDLRLLCVEGRVRHAVGRARYSPFTNLNLDAERIDRSELLEMLGNEWEGMESLAVQGAAALPGARCLGMDVLVRPGGRRWVLLEANAFGDDLPGLLFEGETTYEAQVAACLRRQPPVWGAAS